ncbi:hypothetical protein HDU80_008070 [Chytriomyces hyalinus]|nr:hypothetical protein HDU80_008070 [Chytriomyces hyalinus]
MSTKFLKDLLGTVVAPPQQQQQQQFSGYPGQYHQQQQYPPQQQQYPPQQPYQPQYQQGHPQPQYQQPQPAQPQLPPGWIAQWSTQYRTYFYANTQTGQTQWTVPMPSGPMGIPAPPIQGAPPMNMTPNTQQQMYPYGMPFQPSGRKKALLIGINYTGTRSALAGCVNDAYNLREYLVTHKNYSPDPNHMRVMVDEPREASVPQNIPTTKNLLDAFYWLVHDARPGDVLFLSYSGHGGQTEDLGQERENGLDDTICPLDFERAGQIDSTHLHRCLVTALPLGVRLNVILDCCHSGTLLELPFTYRPDANGHMDTVQLVKRGLQLAMGAQQLLNGNFRNAKSLMGEAKSLFNAVTGSGPQTDQQGYKQENFAQSQSDGLKEAYCISGCQDEQTSADTSFNGRAAGALTHALLSTLKQYPQGLSFEMLLASLRGFMQGQYSQIPQLSCGHKVDPNSPFTF